MKTVQADTNLPTQTQATQNHKNKNLRVQVELS